MLFIIMFVDLKLPEPCGQMKYRVYTEHFYHSSTVHMSTFTFTAGTFLHFFTFNQIWLLGNFHNSIYEMCLISCEVKPQTFISIYWRSLGPNTLTVYQKLQLLLLVLLYLFGVGKLPERWRERPRGSWENESKHREEADRWSEVAMMTMTMMMTMMIMRMMYVH